MTVQLAEVKGTEERARAARKPPKPLVYNGEAIMADVRSAIAASRRAFRFSEAERDALMQSLALRIVERPALMLNGREPKPTPERRAILAHDLADLLRDSRSWLDSQDGWKPRERTERTERGGRIARKAPATLALSVAEQAERFRAAEREQAGRVAPMTSTEALADRHGTDGGTDWLAVASVREHEREHGERLPAPALAEHNRQLTRALARSLQAEHGSVLALFSRSRGEHDLRVALYCHAGEPLEAIALAERISIATAKRRSARGTEALRVIGAEAIRAERRLLAEALGLVPPSDGPVLPEAATAAKRATEAAMRIERRRAAAYASGRRGESRLIGQHGSAAQVLRYMAATERALALPAAEALALMPPLPSTAPGGVTERAERAEHAEREAVLRAERERLLALYALMGTEPSGPRSVKAEREAKRAAYRAERRAAREREAAIIAMHRGDCRMSECDGCHRYRDTATDGGARLCAECGAARRSGDTRR